MTASLSSTTCIMSQNFLPGLVTVWLVRARSSTVSSMRTEMSWSWKLTCRLIVLFYKLLLQQKLDSRNAVLTGINITVRYLYKSFNIIFTILFYLYYYSLYDASTWKIFFKYFVDSSTLSSLVTSLQFDLILLKEKGELLEKCNIGVKQPRSFTTSNLSSRCSFYFKKFNNRILTFLNELS